MVERIRVFVDHEAVDAAAAEMLETVHFDEEPEQGPDGLAVIAPEPDDPDDE